MDGQVGENILDRIRLVAVVNSAANSASAALERTFLRIQPWTKMAPLNGGSAVGGGRTSRHGRPASKIMKNGSAGVSICFGEVGSITFDM